jgi:hypothetical protein
MKIICKNCVDSYLGDWLMAVNIKARLERKPSSGLAVPRPVQSLRRHELNVCYMLERFEERLIHFEASLNNDKKDNDFSAYSEAITFLDAIYLFSRILLDSVAGTVRHFHNNNNENQQIKESFNDLYTKAIEGKLPNKNLNTLFAECKTWFPQFKTRRDDIVHYYETYLIGFDRNSEGDTIAMQISPTQKTQMEDLRSYIGMVMAGYQHFIDGLLDYWDEAFKIWYGVNVFRNPTILLGQRANILWWACRYGGYRNVNIQIEV